MSAARDECGGSTSGGLATEGRLSKARGRSGGGY
jgi:hypothetical protein